MRFGLVIYDSLDRLSGGYLYDRMLVEHLRAQGDSVEVFSLPARHYLANLADNVEQDWFRRLRRAEVDILIQDELNHPSLAWVNPRLRRRVSYRIVSLVHHLRSSEPHPPLAKSIYQAVEKRYLDSVDAFIFNSQTTRYVVRALSPRERPGVVATPGGDRLGHTASREQIRARAEKCDPLRIVFIGNIIPRKGLHVLLEALDRVGGKAWHLDVVGSGAVEPAYMGRIEEQIAQLGMAGQVTLFGPISDAMLIERLEAAHVLCVPSYYEGFGIIYLEAMAFGLPAIGGASGAAHEIIRDGENGYLISSGNVTQLAAKLRGLLRDPGLLLRLSLAARDDFDQAASWQESVASIHTFLKGL